MPALFIDYPAWYRECPWFKYLPKFLLQPWRLIPDLTFTAFAKPQLPGWLQVIVTSNVEADGHEWLHVSCARPDRLPDYDDLCEVKKLFIGEDRLAMQLFVPKSQHVNIYDTALHLWSCLDAEVVPDLRHMMPSGKLAV